MSDYTNIVIYGCALCSSKIASVAAPRSITIDISSIETKINFRAPCSAHDTPVTTNQLRHSDRLIIPLCKTLDIPPISGSCTWLTCHQPPLHPTRRCRSISTITQAQSQTRIGTNGGFACLLAYFLVYLLMQGNYVLHP